MYSAVASCSVWFYADQAFFVPEAGGVSIMALVRKTLDYWLNSQIKPSGEVVCYWGRLDFLDSNAGPLIAAWDYFEVTGDKAWLTKSIERLELVADFSAKRDVDNDGLVEATQSGNRGTLKEPARSCNWFDAVNCGHKDGYSNALIYRGWRCLADLEARLGRTEKSARYGKLADHLKAVYATTLLNPKTGWLAGWKSADGELHDYASTVVNSMAIEYGLVEPEQGRKILAALRAKMDAVGFKRFDLGVPFTLAPVNRSDYLNCGPQYGEPQREDGTDSFQHYLNGAVFGAHVLPFLVAHYMVGEGKTADTILQEMLKRRKDGDFAADFVTWDGKRCGYEGCLAEYFCFLQAALLREPAMRERLLRPLGNRAEGKSGR
jgi:hypothetical protein